LVGLLAVSHLQSGHIALDAGLDLVHLLLQLGLGEVLVSRVHRLELSFVRTFETDRVYVEERMRRIC
jgi:hypothetical protein